MLKHVYNFAGYQNKPDWVDFLKFQPGALISYWDTAVSDNNTSAHPGAGEILPVDAHPEFRHAPDGTLLRSKLQTFDSTFSLRATPTQKIHILGKPYKLKGQRAVSVFDDTQDWWYDSDEHTTGEHAGVYQLGWMSVDVPKTGTTIRVVKVNKKGVMTVKVGKSG